jgi:hypothetical protein
VGDERLGSLGSAGSRSAGRDGDLLAASANGKSASRWVIGILPC